MCYDDVLYKFTFYLLSYNARAHDSGPKHASFHSLFCNLLLFGEYSTNHLGPLHIYVVIMMMFCVKRSLYLILGVS